MASMWWNWDLNPGLPSLGVCIYLTTPAGLSRIVMLSHKCKLLTRGRVKALWHHPMVCKLMPNLVTDASIHFAQEECSQPTSSVTGPWARTQPCPVSHLWELCLLLSLSLWSPICSGLYKHASQLSGFFAAWPPTPFPNLWTVSYPLDQCFMALLLTGFFSLVSICHPMM